MVGHDYLRQAATKAYRIWQTALSRAVLIALGEPLPEPSPARRRRACDGPARAMAQCMANHESPLDGRRG